MVYTMDRYRVVNGEYRGMCEAITIDTASGSVYNARPMTVGHPMAIVDVVDSG